MFFLIPYNVVVVLFFFSRFQPVRKIFFWVSVTRGSVCFMSSLETFEGFLFFFVASLFKHYKQYSVFLFLFVVFAVIVFIPLTFLLLWSSHCRVGMLNGDSAHYANNAHLALWPRARPSDVFIQTLHRSALGFTARTKDALDSSLDSLC